MALQYCKSKHTVKYTGIQTNMYTYVYTHMHMHIQYINTHTHCTFKFVTYRIQNTKILSLRSWQVTAYFAVKIEQLGGSPNKSILFDLYFKVLDLSRVCCLHFFMDVTFGWEMELCLHLSL